MNALQPAVEGTWTDAAGRPARHARVEARPLSPEGLPAEDARAPLAVAYADGAGRARIGLSAPGRYALRAVLPEADRRGLDGRPSSVVAEAFEAEVGPGTTDVAALRPVARQEEAQDARARRAARLAALPGPQGPPGPRGEPGPPGSPGEHGAALAALLAPPDWAFQAGPQTWMTLGWTSYYPTDEQDPTGTAGLSWPRAAQTDPSVGVRMARRTHFLPRPLLPVRPGSRVRLSVRLRHAAGPRVHAYLAVDRFAGAASQGWEAAPWHLLPEHGPMETHAWEVQLPPDTTAVRPFLIFNDHANFSEVVGGVTEVDWVRLEPAEADAPPGAVQAYAGPGTPAGWLPCEGQAVPRGAYAALFAAIGTTWGAGDGATTFGVPDLRGRFPLGSGSGPGLAARALGATGGAESHALTLAQIPAHAHGLVHLQSDDQGLGAALGAGWQAGSGSTGSSGGGQAHPQMPPFAVLRYLIRA